MGSFTCVFILIGAVVIVACVLLLGILLVVGGAFAAKAGRQKDATIASPVGEAGTPARSGPRTVGIVAVIVGLMILIPTLIFIVTVAVAWHDVR